MDVIYIWGIILGNDYFVLVCITQDNLGISYAIILFQQNLLLLVIISDILSNTNPLLLILFSKRFY